jgi:hypothetical protein
MARMLLIGKEKSSLSRSLEELFVEVTSKYHMLLLHTALAGSLSVVARGINSLATRAPEKNGRPRPPIFQTIEAQITWTMALVTASMLF